MSQQNTQPQSSLQAPQPCLGFGAAIANGKRPWDLKCKVLHLKEPWPCCLHPDSSLPSVRICSWGLMSYLHAQLFLLRLYLDAWWFGFFFFFPTPTRYCCAGGRYSGTSERITSLAALLSHVLFVLL